MCNRLGGAFCLAWKAVFPFFGLLEETLLGSYRHSWALSWVHLWRGGHFSCQYSRTKSWAARPQGSETRKTVSICSWSIHRAYVAVLAKVPGRLVDEDELMPWQTVVLKGPTGPPDRARRLTGQARRRQQSALETKPIFTSQIAKRCRISRPQATTSAKFHPICFDISLGLRSSRAFLCDMAEWFSRAWSPAEILMAISYSCLAMWIPAVALDTGRLFNHPDGV